VPIKAPEGIEFEVPQPTRVIIKGNSKQQVGEIAAIIRKQRPPEPYKGKGIRYQGEYVARKVVSAHDRPHAPRPAPQAPPPRSARRCAGPPSVRASRCSAPTADLRPAHRRRRRPHAGRRQLDEADLRSLKPLEQAKKAGELLAERAKAAAVETAVFDRGGYQYHGRVKALAEAPVRAD
jgi:hypothetical protein